MCGIAGGFGVDGRSATDAIAALRHRGPDAAGSARVGEIGLAHARLAILDLDDRSNQPFARDGIWLTYNGECWNYEQLRRDLEADGATFATTGDTEVVAAAIARWGTAALPLIEGMFAMAWTDGETLWVARDRFGEVPVHVSGRTFASEIRAFPALGSDPVEAAMLPPGHVLEIGPDGSSRSARWYEPPIAPLDVDLEEASLRLRERILEGCRERAISDVPVCTLLSGGVDSSIVAAGLRPWVPGLVSFTAVLEPGSRDLREARAAAEMIGIPLIEVPVEPPTVDDLRGVVRTIEMPHKAQVEIGWACLRLADAMRAEGFKVTFSGEGSDELWASYGFAYHALRTQDWHRYRRDLFVGQHRKNFARCNKVFLSRGIECRLPFLHTDLVELALRLPRSAVQDGRSKPKAVLQRAASGLVPPKVATRAKVAFQDGMGLKRAIAETVADPGRVYRSEFAAYVLELAGADRLDVTV